MVAERMVGDLVEAVLDSSFELFDRQSDGGVRAAMIRLVRICIPGT